MWHDPAHRAPQHRRRRLDHDHQPSVVLLFDIDDVKPVETHQKVTALNYGGQMNGWGALTGVVRLPDGRLVRGTGRRKPRGDAPVPDFAVYLLGRDPQVKQWPNRWVRWRDFRLPDSTEHTLAVLREVHARAAYERIEIACGGGIGRTGTAIAVLAVMSGINPNDAVDWVRTNYHPRAVETRRQRAWITSSVAALP